MVFVKVHNAEELPRLLDQIGSPNLARDMWWTPGAIQYLQGCNFTMHDGRSNVERMRHISLHYFKEPIVPWREKSKTALKLSG